MNDSSLQHIARADLHHPRLIMQANARRPVSSARACSACSARSPQEGHDQLHQRSVLLVHAGVARQRLCEHAHHRCQRVLCQEGLPYCLQT